MLCDKRQFSRRRGSSPARCTNDRLRDNPMLIGYARVSKADGSQVLDLQRDALLDAGVRAEHLYEDKASGNNEDRPALAACLKALRHGDTLVIWKLDRLGRNLKHLIDTAQALT